MAMGPFTALNENYFQLGNGNDSTRICQSYQYFNTAYDVKVRTTANNDGTNVGRTIIAPGDLLFSKRPTEFVYNAYTYIP